MLTSQTRDSMLAERGPTSIEIGIRVQRPLPLGSELTLTWTADWTLNLEPNPGHLAESRIGLLGRRRIDPRAHSALLGTPLQRRRLVLLLHLLASEPDELIDGRHTPH